jgi:hypothetical protein
MENAVVVKTTSSINFPINLSHRNCLLMDDDNDLHLEDCRFVCRLYKNHHIASTVVIWLGNLLILSAISIRSSDMFIRISFCSRVSRK